MTKRMLWLIALTLSLCLPVVAQDKPDPAKPAAAAPDSEAELRRAIESAGRNSQQVIVNLEDYLQRFPQSQRRAEIEREIYRLSHEARDRDRAISYGTKVVAANERDVETLSTLVTLLRERKGEGDLKQALAYADRLIDQVEKVLGGPKPKRMSAAQWDDRKERGLASVLLLRGQVWADLGEADKARDDLLKSYRHARLAGTAVALADLAEKRREVDQALDYYLQALVVSLVANEELDRAAVRAKFGKLYAARHGSEAGLGDRLLRAYDEYIKERAARLARVDGPNLNAGVTDPFLFQLTRLDGPAVRLADFRGKVIVLNFWATWCGPCLIEAPLFEKTMEKYKDDREVVFLGVNTDEDRELVEPFLKKQKWKMPMAFAESLDERYGVESIPTTMVFDRRGQVSYRQAGFNPRGDFVALLTEKIEEARKK